jgi:hypothetical protein
MSDLSDVPHPKATAALANAKRFLAQTEPSIWFDSWGNDLRDNNLDGTIDDPGEKGPDGSHHSGTYAAKVAPLGRQTVADVPAKALRTIRVSYRVCIDIPIEAYRMAGVPISNSRWIPTFFTALRAMPGWQVWLNGARPPSLLDGDIVSANNAAHQHAGIVETGIFDSVINLPGPTSARRYGVYAPSGLNDMVSVPRILFESVLGIECYARWVGV